jgi:hypothetical protein
MDTEKHTVEYNEKGNIVISYKVVKYDFFSLRFVLPVILLLSLNLYEYTSTGQFFTVVITIPLIFFFFYRWAVKTEKINEKAEEQIISENLNDIIKRDVKSFGDSIIELKRMYKIIINNREPERRYLMIILSNGIEIRYDIINAKQYDEICVLEIDTHYKINQ